MTATVREVFRAAACSLALLTDDEEELLFVAAAGAGASQVLGVRLPTSTGIAGFVVSSGQALAVTDPRRDPRFALDVAEQTGFVPTSILAVPVATPERTYGVLEVLDRDEDRAGSADDLRLLSLFADQAALTLAGARGLDDVGRVLLEALARVDDADPDLAAGFAAAAADLPEVDADLLALARLFADLAASDTAARRLALRLVTDVAGYAREGSRRRR
jgi:GAF domain-containing protein